MLAELTAFGGRKINSFMEVSILKKGMMRSFLFLVFLFCAVLSVSTPAFATITKSVTGTFLPGSQVTYTIDYSFGVVNFETATATITDTPAASLTFGTAQNDTNFDHHTYNGTTVTWDSTGGPFNPGTYSGTVSYTATIDSNAVPGTVISNNACLAVDTVATPGLRSGAALVTECDVASFTVTQLPKSVPTMTEWGMIIFMIFAGIVSVYYLRRQRRVN